MEDSARPLSCPPRASLTVLGTLRGPNSSTDFHPRAVNNGGKIVGSATTDDNIVTAFLWKNGKMIDLGTLPGGSQSQAHSLDDSGRVIGYSDVNGENRAFFWANGRMIGLGTLGGTEAVAVGMNNVGQIVGWSKTPTGETKAVLWTVQTTCD